MTPYANFSHLYLCLDVGIRFNLPSASGYDNCTYFKELANARQHGVCLVHLIIFR